MHTPRRRQAATMAAALAALVLAGCGTDEAQDAPAPPAQVSVATLVPGDLLVADDLPGRVAAVRTAEIRAQVGGIVQRRLFEQGAEIRQGAPLFRINPAPFQADADLAEAALQRAQAAWARARLQAGRLEPL
ncbi:efflux transporter periplasmic adaptor subunit, partial [Paracidovorax avenae]|uniref:HlyD family efflux transporter periplasmic adaptor subunit n=1 Tax=Paracidovorax avenae TaxID=80867 RepID=UPI000D216172